MKNYYLQKADENLPKLITTEIKPDVTADVLGRGDSLVIDLGNHYVGYLSFRMWFVDQYIDAPVRMALRFCETERELYDDYLDYHGRLCESWLQEEIINIDFPGEYKLPRRYAARYIKITVLFTPKELSLSDFVFQAVTSADSSALKAAQINDAELLAIDRIALNTLRNCMQRIFEDGPKRDRRLWIGDLRLEALANYYTFGNTDIVRRCLYLFAASEKNEHGFMPGFVFEDPVFASGRWFIEDYSLMYVCTLCDYLKYTKDENTFRDLYPVARSIMDAMDKTADDTGIVTMRGGDAFIDWCPGLRKEVALHGIYLYTLDLWCEVLEALNCGDIELYRQRLAQGRKAARCHFYDEQKNVFIGKRDEFQYSVHSTAWMILGGVISGERAKDAMLAVLNAEGSVKPFTPYMHHYTVDALIASGATDEAQAYVRKIWGGMVKQGGDTFFEVYVPNDPDFSPYGDRKINSMCHAWSCTATYFIRKYGW